MAQFMTIQMRRRAIFRAVLGAILFIFNTVACSTEESTVSRQAFWTEFRQAVLASDVRKLAGMTDFPLEVRGVDDSQPAEKYSKEQFEGIIGKLLAQPVFSLKANEVVTSTTKDVIRSTNTITKDHAMTANSFRVDQLVFELRNGRWKLVRAFLEDYKSSPHVGRNEHSELRRMQTDPGLRRVPSGLRGCWCFF
jgi:hypothetical protein